MRLLSFNHAMKAHNSLFIYSLQREAFFLVPAPGSQKFFGGYAAMIFAFFGFLLHGPR